MKRKEGIDMHLTMMHMGIIIATLVCVIGIGIYSSRSVRSAAGYSVGGRSAGAPLVAGSIAGTVVGGGATVGTAQLAYHFGLSAWWFTLGSGIAFIIMGLFYAKKMRGTGLETIPQFLAMHYGKKAEELSSVISSIGILFSAVASCLPGIEIVAEVFHVDAYTASALLILLVAAYTFFGGMKSAGIGGMLKMGIIWVALFIAGWEAFQAVHETAAWSQFPATQFSLFGRGAEPALANLFSVLVGVLCTQTYIIMLPYFYISYKNLHACPFPFRICPCSVSVSLPEAVFLLRKFQHKHKHTPFPVRWCKDCFIVNRNLFPAQFKQYFVKMLFIHTAEYHKALLWCAAGKWCCEHVLFSLCEIPDTLPQICGFDLLQADFHWRKQLFYRFFFFYLID